MGAMLTLRISEEMMKRLDELAFERSRPGAIVSRGDVVRDLLADALKRTKRKR